MSNYYIYNIYYYYSKHNTSRKLLILLAKMDLAGAPHYVPRTSGKNFKAKNHNIKTVNKTIKFIIELQKR